MTSVPLASPESIVDWFQKHMRKGEGLSAPYARRWELSGRAATNSLWDWPSDRLATLAELVFSLNHPVFGVDNGVLVDIPRKPVWLSCNRSSPGDGPPDAYVVRLQPDFSPRYVGNAPEVIAQLLRKLITP
jgi:hypothetical protein